jgi:hypothetical protein
VAEYGLPFPRLSSDELEQFLVSEAVMHRHYSESAGRAEMKRREQAAHEAGKKQLEEMVGRPIA